MNHRRALGLTLVELMVTLSVLAIVVALAAPSFNDSLPRTRVKSQGSDVVNLLALAKSESLKRNQVTTTVTVSNSGATWEVATEWQAQDGSKERRSVVNVNDVKMVNPTTASSTLTADFRGLFSGFVSTNNCGTGDTCIQLRSPGDKYDLRIGINAVGQVVACTVNQAFGGYAQCQ